MFFNGVGGAIGAVFESGKKRRAPRTLIAKIFLGYNAKFALFRRAIRYLTPAEVIRNIY